MTASFFSGPVVGLGGLMGGGDAKAQMGPFGAYHGYSLLHPQYYPANKDGQASGRIPAFLSNSRIVVADNIPSTVSANGIAAAAAAVSGTAMTLTTVAPGGASTVPSLGTAIPVVLQGSSTPVNALVIDFGFTTGTTTAGSATVAAVPDSTLFTVGQWICIAGAGNAAKTSPLITQVKTLVNATSITVSPTPAGSLAHAPIGAANVFGNFPQGAVPNAVFPYSNAGSLAIFNPVEGLARGISVLSGASAAGGVIRVVGADIHGVSMSEDITAGAGAGTAYGKKAFKYIISVTPQFSDSGGGHTYAIGWSDTFGYALRADRWEYNAAYWNGLLVPSAVGFTAAVLTDPATRTTGDVRGSVQVGSAGAGTPITAAASSNGALRLTLVQTVAAYNILNSSPANMVPLLGVTQV